MTPLVLRWLPDPWRGWLTVRRGRHWTRALVHARRHNAALPLTAPTIDFYPMRPDPGTSMALILARLGVRIGHSPRPDRLAFAWDTDTWFSQAALQRLPEGAVNRSCLDISKQNVDRLWAQVAGYSISVDPLTTHGPIVVKPDRNGGHGGRIVTGPIGPPRRGWVYQRLVDTREDDGRILQIRLVIIGGRIVVTHAKWRPYPNLFHGTRLTLPRPTDELFSPAEQQLVLHFVRLIGLDYGELDVLRDRASGRLYVVDANRTPRQPKALAPEHREIALGLQADAVRALLPD